MDLDTPPSPLAPNPSPLIPWRTILWLGGCVFVLAGVAALPGLSAGGVALGGLSSAANLPENLIVASLGLAIFAGPLMFGADVLRTAPWRDVLGRAGLAGVWLGVATLFVLNLAARIAPVQQAGVPVGALTCALVTAIAIVLHALWEGGALSVLLGWVVLLPVATYFVNDVFLASAAGGTPLVELTSVGANRLREWNHAVLQFSPGTFVLGVMNGTLLDGSESQGAAGVLGILAVLLVTSGILYLRRRGIRTDAGASVSAPQSRR